MVAADEPGVLAEERMGNVAQQGVKYRFCREDVNASAPECGEADRGIVAPAGAHRVAQHGDLHAVGHGVERGLVDADRGLDPANQQVPY